MIPGTLLLVTTCGPDTNPKEEGFYLTESKYGFDDLYFDGEWRIDKDKNSRIVNWEFVWLKPVGPLEDLQRESEKKAFDAGFERGGYFGVTNKTFTIDHEFEDYCTKKQEEK